MIRSIPRCAAQTGFLKPRRRSCRSNRKSSPRLKSWLRRLPSSPATVRQFPRPRSAGVSPIANGWSGRISGIRRIWCRLVEVIQNERTSGEVVERTMQLLRRAGKVPVHVRRDIPGFVGNRLQHAMKREAIALVAAGVCDAETIDVVVREGFGARTAVLGPMEQSDLVGLDLALDIAEVLYAHLDRTAGPHPFLRDKVKHGKLG